MATARQILGATPRRWFEYLVAILLGNAIYAFCLSPHLPAVLRHPGTTLDWGVVVNFVVCASVYGLIRLGIHLHQR